MQRTTGANLAIQHTMTNSSSKQQQQLQQQKYSNTQRKQQRQKYMAGICKYILVRRTAAYSITILYQVQTLL